MNNQGGEKRGFKIVFVIAGIAFVLMFAIVNASTLAGAASSVLAVFSPIIIGFAIAYALNPILRIFEFKVFKNMKRKNLNRGLSIFLTYVVAFLVITLLVCLLLPQIVKSINSLVNEYDVYVSTATNFINNFINKIVSNKDGAKYINEEQTKEAIRGFFSKSGNVLGGVMEYIVEYGMGLFVGIKNLILGLFISVYVLISKEKLQAQARKLGAALFSEQKVNMIGKYINITHTTFSNYFVGKIFSAIIVTVIMFVLMMCCGMTEFALLVSFIIGVTDIIPIFGPIIGAVPSFFIIFISSPEKALLFLILIIVVQQIEGNIIAPKILGDATGISSLCVIIAIIIMGAYFGFVGMLIGVPVFAVCTMIVKEMVETRLRKKHKPIETEEYYLANSVVDPYADHTPTITKLVLGMKRKLKKLKKNRHRKAEEHKKQENQNNDNNENKEN
ncbi:MAG: AI-2E family transporter [Ruminococcaceae bacterium]|nr:AI-2E family transporter [Oscillospiraceae bacterium]